MFVCIGFYDTVDSMVKWFQFQFALNAYRSTTHNPFTGRKFPTSGFDRSHMPWELPRRVAMGTSGPVGYAEAKQHYKKYVKQYMKDSLKLDLGDSEYDSDE